MGESGQEGDGLFGPARGGPTRPLAEAFIVFITFYLASYLSAGTERAAVSRPAFHLVALAVNLPRALLLVYIMATGDGFAAFGLRRIEPRDLPRALITALGAFMIIAAASFLFSMAGVQNPLFSGTKPSAAAGAAIIPLFLASSMATGYCEELFFRAYLMRRLGQAGMSPAWAALASSLLFGSGHAYQGLVGLVSGSLLGLFFAWRWIDTRNIHAVAIGHGLYDAAAFAILVYS